MSLGAALAGYGRRVLLVDFDPQGALSVALGYNPNEMERTVYNLLTDPTAISVTCSCKPTSPAWTSYPATSTCRRPRSNWYRKWAGSTPSSERWPVVADYDIVLIDCQPSLAC